MLSILQTPVMNEKTLRVVAQKPVLLSPDLVVDKWPAKRGNIHVVRDDLLEGGTKQRAALPYIRDQVQLGYREFIYASPFCGFAQIALAAACKQLGVSCTLFCEQDNSYANPKRALHDFSRIAATLGARVYSLADLAAAEAEAAHYSELNPRRLKVPLGFNCTSFRTHLRQQLSSLWEQMTFHSDVQPKTLWLPLGSGTLANVFHEMLGGSVNITCVNINVLASNDPRLQALSQKARVRVLQAPELFSEKSELLPPFPSNIHYDAKLWRFVHAHADAGDVLWNVAR